MPNSEGLGAYLNNPVMFGPQFRVVDVSGIFEESTSMQTISIELSNPFSSNYMPVSSDISMTIDGVALSSAWSDTTSPYISGVNVSSDAYNTPYTVLNVTISSNNDISDSTIVLTDIANISPENDSAGELHIPTEGVTASIFTNYSRLESTTYDNNEGAVVLEFAKAMTLNEGANGTVRIDGTDYGVAIPSSALSSNGKILTIDTDLITDFPVISPRTSMTIAVDGLLHGEQSKNIMEEMVSLSIPTPVIPGGDVGDEGGVVLYALWYRPNR